MKNRPTPDEIAEFDNFVEQWQVQLNLCDWRIERGPKPAKAGVMADVQCDSVARLATYRIGDFAGEPITPESLEKTALHECLHVFLHDLVEVSRNPSSNDDDIASVEHRVINVLERLLCR